jgi:hypothetical protein
MRRSSPDKPKSPFDREVLVRWGKRLGAAALAAAAGCGTVPPSVPSPAEIDPMCHVNVARIGKHVFAVSFPGGPESSQDSVVVLQNGIILPEHATFSSTISPVRVDIIPKGTFTLDPSILMPDGTTQNCDPTVVTV